MANGTGISLDQLNGLTTFSDSDLMLVRDVSAISQADNAIKERKATLGDLKRYFITTVSINFNADSADIHQDLTFIVNQKAHTSLFNFVPGPSPDIGLGDRVVSRTVGTQPAVGTGGDNLPAGVGLLSNNRLVYLSSDSLTVKNIWLDSTEYSVESIKINAQLGGQEVVFSHINPNLPSSGNWENAKFEFNDGTFLPATVESDGEQRSLSKRGLIAYLDLEEFQPTKEDIYPSAKAILKQGGNIIITPNDSGSELTISSPGGANTVLGTSQSVVFQIPEVANTTLRTTIANVPAFYNIASISGNGLTGVLEQSVVAGIARVTAISAGYVNLSWEDEVQIVSSNAGTRSEGEFVMAITQYNASNTDLRSWIYEHAISDPVNNAFEFPFSVSTGIIPVGEGDYFTFNFAFKINQSNGNLTFALLADNPGLDERIEFIYFPTASITGAETPTSIKNKLQTLTGNARLSANSIKDIEAENVSVTSSGFDGNLAPSDNNMQKVSQKLDDLEIRDDRFIALQTLPTNLTPYKDNQILGIISNKTLYRVIQNTEYGHVLKFTMARGGSSSNYLYGFDLVDQSPFGSVSYLEGGSLNANTSPVGSFYVDSDADPEGEYEVGMEIKESAISTADRVYNTIYVRFGAGFQNAFSDELPLARGTNLTKNGVVYRTYSFRITGIRRQNFVNAVGQVRTIELYSQFASNSNNTVFDIFNEKTTEVFEPDQNTETGRSIKQKLESLTGNDRLSATAIKDLPRDKFFSIENKPTDLTSYEDNDVIAVISEDKIYAVKQNTSYGHAMRLTFGIQTQGGVVNRGVSLVGTSIFGSVATREGESLNAITSPVGRIDFKFDPQGVGQADDSYTINVLLKKSAIPQPNQGFSPIFMAIYTGIPSEGTFEDSFPLTKASQDKTIEGFIYQEYNFDTLTQIRWDNLLSYITAQNNVLYVEFYKSFTTYASRGDVFDIFKEKELEEFDTDSNKITTAQAKLVNTLPTNPKVGDVIEPTVNNLTTPGGTLLSASQIGTVGATNSGVGFFGTAGSIDPASIEISGIVDYANVASTSASIRDKLVFIRNGSSNFTMMSIKEENQPSVNYTLASISGLNHYYKAQRPAGTDVGGNVLTDNTRYFVNFTKQNGDKLFPDVTLQRNVPYAFNGWTWEKHPIGRQDEDINLLIDQKIPRQNRTDADTTGQLFQIKETWQGTQSQINAYTRKEGGVYFVF